MRKHLTKRRIVCYLSYFALICMLAFGVTDARYYSEVTGMGTARTAAVEMNTEIDLTDQLQGVVPNGKKEIEFSVNNFKDGSISDVAQEYTIAVTTTGNLPFKYELKGDSSESGTLADIGPAAVGYSLVWSGGKLPTGASATHKYTLIVSWPSDMASDSYADEIELVTLTVDAKQVKPEIK